MLYYYTVQLYDDVFHYVCLAMNSSRKQRLCWYEINIRRNFFKNLHSWIFFKKNVFYIWNIGWSTVGKCFLFVTVNNMLVLHILHLFLNEMFFIDFHAFAMCMVAVSLNKNDTLSCYFLFSSITQRLIKCFFNSTLIGIF